MTPAVLAVDIGGTKLAAALVDGSGRVHRRSQRPTGAPSDAEELWQTLAGLLDHVVGDVAVSAVGAGCGGPMRWPAGDVSPVYIPAWRDFPLRRRLADRFPGVPVRVHNDAVALVAGEHWRGAGAGRPGVLGMVVSTGVGGGLVLDGRLVDGTTGNAGHVGHVVVDPSGPGCGCGGRGCLEAIARGPALAAWAAAQGWRPARGGAADAVALAADARAGSPVALAAFQRAGQALGVAVASAVALTDVDRVVVGGGVANAGDLLFGPARVAFARHAGLDFARRCELVPAALGRDAGLVGAAALVLAGDRYWHGEDGRTTVGGAD